MTIKSIQTKLNMHWFAESWCELARIIFVLQWSHFVTSGGNDKAVYSEATTCPTPFKNMYSCVVLKIQASWTNINQGAKLICSNLEMYRILFCVCLKSLSFRLPSHAEEGFVQSLLFLRHVLYLMWRLQQQQGNAVSCCYSTLEEAPVKAFVSALWSSRHGWW
jgi:hypothetical protein